MWFDAQLFEIKRFDQQYGYVGVPTTLNIDSLSYLCTKFVPYHQFDWFQ